MTEENVTLVTRNEKYPELKVALDLVVWVGFLYFLTHPDAFDRAKDKARHYRVQFVHLVSVWTFRQDIRSLPETEEDDTA